MTDSAKKGEYGKLLNRLRVKVEGQQYDIEVYNKETQADDFKIYSVVVNGEVYKVEVEDLGLEDRADSTPKEPAAPKPEQVQVPLAKPVAEAPQPPPEPTAPSAPTKGEGVVVAPMPGKVLTIKVNVGDKVKSGQPVLILEAMKMENILNAPVSGTVTEIKVAPGTNANQGDELIVIE